MKYTKQGLKKFAASAVVMIGMAVAAGWNFYLFIVVRNAGGPLDTQGGRYHLWLATAAILTAFVSACLMFLFFPGSGRSEIQETPLSPLEPRPLPLLSIQMIRRHRFTLMLKPGRNKTNGGWRDSRMTDGR